MSEILNGFVVGFSNCLEPSTLLYIILGSIFGTFAGAMPGLGAVSGVALMLPVAITMPLQTGIAFLVTISLGCSFGGRITAILINVPGDSTAVVTAYDGYPMMQKGLGGKAMGITAFASFIGGMFSFLLLGFVAQPIARVALKLSPADTFAIMVFGFTTIISLSDRKIIVKNFVFMLLGMLLSTVGVDLISGYKRFVFTPAMYDGISFVIVVLGMYGISEAIFNAEKRYSIDFSKASMKFKDQLPSKKDLKEAAKPIARGSLLGSFVGVLPGAGGTIATFMSYAFEKSVSKHPERFGTGEIAGIAGPEASNNAVVGSALIPMFALGIPGSSVAAMLMGVLTMFGLQPGPRIFETSTVVVWTTICGLIVANFVLLGINTLAIPVFVRAIKAIQPYLKPIIVVLCLFGTFAIAGTMTAMWIAVLFALLGYFVKKLDLPASSLILALILTPNMENNLRQTLIISRGDYSVFFTRPVSCIFLILSVVAICIPFIKAIIDKKKAKKAGR